MGAAELAALGALKNKLTGTTDLDSVTAAISGSLPERLQAIYELLQTAEAAASAAAKGGTKFQHLPYGGFDLSLTKGERYSVNNGWPEAAGTSAGAAVTQPRWHPTGTWCALIIAAGTFKLVAYTPTITYAGAGGGMGALTTISPSIGGATINDLSWSPDGNWALLTTTGGWYIASFNSSTGSFGTWNSVTGSSGVVWGKFHPEGTYIGGFGNGVATFYCCTFDTSTGTAGAISSAGCTYAPNGIPSGWVWSPTGNTIFCATTAGNGMSAWHFSGSATLSRHNDSTSAPGGGTYSVAVSNDGTRVLLGGGGSPYFHVYGFEESVLLSSSGSPSVYAGWGTKVSNSVAAHTETNTKAVAFSPDGSCVAVGDTGEVKYYDTDYQDGITLLATTATGLATNYGMETMPADLEYEAGIFKLMVGKGTAPYYATTAWIQSVVLPNLPSSLVGLTLYEVSNNSLVISGTDSATWTARQKAGARIIPVANTGQSVLSPLNLQKVRIAANQATQFRAIGVLA